MRRAFCVLLATLLWLAVGPLASVRAEGLEFEAKPESLGDIPDPGFCFEFGDGLDVQFEVSGVESVEQVEVELTIEHDWVGELQADLIAPDGTGHALFGRTLAIAPNSAGSSAKLDGTYTFSDWAGSVPEANWWLQALLAEYVRGAVPPGAYRTSGPGGVNAGMTALTSMDEAFEGAQANGTWTLRVRDICGGGSGRTGRITGAKLRLEHVGSPATPPETPDPPGESLTFDAVRGTLGKIPDPPDDGSESCEVDPGVREVRFRASGLTELEGVEVELALKHPWVSDLEAYLIGPDGTERLLFGGVWSGGIADGTYTFADRARGEPSGGWWQEARVSDWLGRPMASATYRTTAFGDGPLRQSFPAPTSLDEVFVGRPANGTWKLRILDVCPLYAGEVSGARLRLVGPRESVAPKLKLKRPKVNAKRRSVRLAFSASDDTTPQADLAFSCRLDGKRFRPCKSPVTYKRLKPGRHRITVRVSDAAGNRAQASKGFKVPKPKRRR